ncbi:MAG: hypothetical protein L0K86_07415 [Actinomycetia bacterium]|nr:hypothetical protein [Actinomycetes bacterium]
MSDAHAEVPCLPSSASILLLRCVVIATAVMYGVLLQLVRLGGQRSLLVLTGTRRRA